MAIPGPSPRLDSSFYTKSHVVVSDGHYQFYSCCISKTFQKGCFKEGIKCDLRVLLNSGIIVFGGPIWIKRKSKASHAHFVYIILPVSCIQGFYRVRCGSDHLVRKI